MGALAAAWYASRLMARTDRRARDEEHRRTIALQYADAARRLSKEITGLASQVLLPNPDHRTVEDALEQFNVLTGRIVRLYSNYSVRGRIYKTYKWIMAHLPKPLRRHVASPHERFAVWVALIGQAVDLLLDVHFMNSTDPRQLMNKLRATSADVKDIEHTTLEWLRAPGDWKPDRSTRQVHERIQSQLADLNARRAAPE
ncbi:hypothetical protein [Nonomuraea polychroma]|uniref:hypothetical protein n=1 Tax=Nonomuraea polychroma TaxID=46176 RepID=UPI000FDF1AB5|nr:hypothetical protein [Nonomuraea polychroma]